MARARFTGLMQGNGWRDHWRVRGPPLASLLACSSFCLPASPSLDDGSVFARFSTLCS